MSKPMIDTPLHAFERSFSSEGMTVRAFLAFVVNTFQDELRPALTVNAVNNSGGDVASAMLAVLDADDKLWYPLTVEYAFPGEGEAGELVIDTGDASPTRIGDHVTIEQTLELVRPMLIGALQRRGAEALNACSWAVNGEALWRNYRSERGLLSAPWNYAGEACAPGLFAITDWLPMETQPVVKHILFVTNINDLAEQLMQAGEFRPIDTLWACRLAGEEFATVPAVEAFTFRDFRYEEASELHERATEYLRGYFGTQFHEMTDEAMAFTPVLPWDDKRLERVSAWVGRLDGGLKGMGAAPVSRDFLQRRTVEERVQWLGQIEELLMSAVADDVIQNWGESDGAESVMDAYFIALAEQYPAITTGDFPPDAHMTALGHCETFLDDLAGLFDNTPAKDDLIASDAAKVFWSNMGTSARTWLDLNTAQPQAA